MEVIDKQFVQTVVAEGIDSNPADFVSLSLGNTKVLQSAGKPNLIYKWSKCVFGEASVVLYHLTSSFLVQCVLIILKLGNVKLKTARELKTTHT